VNDRCVALPFDGLNWALLPPGLPVLADRVDSLEEHLELALGELRAIGDEASWMLREAEDALDLALSLLRDELAAVLTPAG
jgi:hypothetical protein